MIIFLWIETKREHDGSCKFSPTLYCNILRRCSRRMKYDVSRFGVGLFTYFFPFTATK